MKEKNKSTIIILLTIIFLVSLYFNFFDNDKINIVAITTECIELWEKKKERAFGNEIGNYRVIYNTKLDTCIAGNIYDQHMNTGFGDKYFIFVIDLVTDKVLLSYQTFGDDTEDEGVTWDEAIKEYESFGLRVF